MTATEQTSADLDFEALAQAVDSAVKAVDELEPDAQDVARDVREAVEAFHRAALVQIVQTLKADPRGKELLFDLVDRPEVRAVFALHGIIRADPVTRARQALETCRPYLQSHGGDVELVSLEDGVASVRLHGACNGCSMSAVTLRDGVEEALLKVDEISSVAVLDDKPTTAFIPLGSVGVRRKEETGWVRGPEIATLDPDGMVRFDTTPASGGSAEGGDSFVITNVGQRIAVFRNECVHQGLTLDGGLIDQGVITCPWHGLTFDASSGECLSSPGAQLQPVPTRIEDGYLWIRAGGE